ncbi:hypothetical protein ABZ920_28540 [Streptomyces sp. NPDC046831]|uniref:effector-associated constant component EACC1 n=1 Tax=Streptomyces sp. NPDC046831 TaxID=3154805 RepID=UPI003400DCEE
MAEGEGVAGRGIRVRLDGSASRSDVGALKAWLEREKPLEELVRAGRLRILERPRTDGPPGHMGTGMEIVLAVVTSAATVGFEQLLAQTTRAVSAWLANRREVESGDPPEGRVDPVNLDEG